MVLNCSMRWLMSAMLRVSVLSLSRHYRTSQAAMAMCWRNLRWSWPRRQLCRGALVIQQLLICDRGEIKQVDGTLRLMPRVIFEEFAIARRPQVVSANHRRIVWPG